jgi:hypothetical protein
MALNDANEIACDPGYEMEDQSRQILTSFGLLEADGRMRSDVRAVVLSAMRGEGADLHVGLFDEFRKTGSPALPGTQDKHVLQILIPRARAFSAKSSTIARSSWG